MKAASAGRMDTNRKDRSKRNETRQNFLSKDVFAILNYFQYYLHLNFQHFMVSNFVPMWSAVSRRHPLHWCRPMTQECSSHPHAYDEDSDKLYIKKRRNNNFSYVWSDERDWAKNPINGEITYMKEEDKIINIQKHHHLKDKSKTNRKTKKKPGGAQKKSK